MCYPRRSQLIPLRGRRLAKIGAGLQTGAKHGNFAGTTDDYHRDTSLTGTLQLLEPLRRKIADQRPRELSPNNSRSTKSGCAKFPGSDATVCSPREAEPARQQKPTTSRVTTVRDRYDRQFGAGTVEHGARASTQRSVEMPVFGRRAAV
jgi:hypothetical protein